MMMPTLDADCTSALNCIHSFQPLTAAGLAVAGALISGFAIWRSARLTDRREREHAEEVLRRQTIYVAQRLSSDTYAIRRRARSVQGSIKVMAAATKGISSEENMQNLALAFSPLAEDWQSVATLPADVQLQLFEFQEMLDVHRGYVKPGTVFGKSTHTEAALDHLDKVRDAANKLGGALQLAAKQQMNAKRAAI